MYLLSALHGHGTSSTPVGERHADRVHARDELAILAERVESALAHPGHDPHGHRDVGGIGELRPRCERSASRAGPSRTARRTSCGPPCSRRRGRSASRASPRARASCSSGPASFSSLGQMKVRSSTRATSAGIGERRGRSWGAWRPRAARTCPRRPAAGRARRTPRQSRHTSGRRPAWSVRRSRRPRPAASCSASQRCFGSRVSAGSSGRNRGSGRPETVPDSGCAGPHMSARRGLAVASSVQSNDRKGKRMATRTGARGGRATSRAALASWRSGTACSRARTPSNLASRRAKATYRGSTRRTFVSMRSRPRPAGPISKALAAVDEITLETKLGG